MELSFQLFLPFSALPSALRAYGLQRGGNFLRKFEERNNILFDKTGLKTNNYNDRNTVDVNNIRRKNDFSMYLTKVDR